jgi:hypothetical protein
MKSSYSQNASKQNHASNEEQQFIKTDFFPSLFQNEISHFQAPTE